VGGVADDDVVLGEGDGEALVTEGCEAGEAVGESGDDVGRGGYGGAGVGVAEVGGAGGG
jgi:hypothetical protein